MAAWVGVSAVPSVSHCCDHGREIAELRMAVDALRQQVDDLRRAAAPAAAGPQIRPMARDASPGAPRSGGGLPYADRDSPDAIKIALFRALFAGREDVYAYRWENAATGQKGWAPRRRPGSRKEDDELLPLTDEVVADHLRDNPNAVGLYVLLSGSTCRLLACRAR
jgi:hypothetical protein